MFFLTTVGTKQLLSFPHPLTSPLPVLPPIYFIRCRIHSVNKHDCQATSFRAHAHYSCPGHARYQLKRRNSKQSWQMWLVFWGGTKLRGGSGRTNYGGYVSPEISIRPELCEGCCGAEGSWGPVSAEERVPSGSDKSHTPPLLHLSNLDSEFS